jgi:Rps23 Pro-64 3,4-dihydroxylase Tpa1-like proline 4-hydroxylase
MHEAISMKDQLTELIVNRLNEAKENLKKQFFQTHLIKVAHHFTLDNLLPIEIAERIYTNFPKPSQMRLLNSPGELKFKYSYVKNESTLLQDIHFAIQDPRVIAVIEEITEIKNQVPDKSRIAGAVSTLLKGHYINPHLDNSHDIEKKLYQTVNLLYYVSPHWKLENGGNYELWDESITNRMIVPSLFNRLLVMETNQTSWHSVNRVVCNAPRCCVFNYYFSENPPRGHAYFHTASSLFFNPLIRPRPEQKIRRAIMRIKNTILKGKNL